jgi:hypothetical protein
MITGTSNALVGRVGSPGSSPVELATLIAAGSDPRRTRAGAGISAARQHDHGRKSVVPTGRIRPSTSGESPIVPFSDGMYASGLDRAQFSPWRPNDGQCNA